MAAPRPAPPNSAPRPEHSAGTTGIRQMQGSSVRCEPEEPECVHPANLGVGHACHARSTSYAGRRRRRPSAARRRVFDCEVQWPPGCGAAAVPRVPAQAGVSASPSVSTSTGHSSSRPVSAAPAHHAAKRPAAAPGRRACAPPLAPAHASVHRAAEGDSSAMRTRSRPSAVIAARASPRTVVASARSFRALGPGPHHVEERVRSRIVAAVRPRRRHVDRRKRGDGRGRQVGAIGSVVRQEVLGLPAGEAERQVEHRRAGKRLTREVLAPQHPFVGGEHSRGSGRGVRPSSAHSCVDAATSGSGPGAKRPAPSTRTVAA